MRFVAFLIVCTFWTGVESRAQAPRQNTKPFDTTLPVTNVQKLAWDDVPDAAQRTLKSQADGGDMTAVARATLRGQAVYIGSFPSDGNIMEIVVKPDGTLVAGESSPDFAQLAAAPASATNQAGIPALPGGTNGVAAAGIPPTEPAGALSAANTAANGNVTTAPAAGTTAATATKMTWSDLPEAVQTGFRSQTDSARIQEITVGTVDGQTVYDIRYRDGDENSQARVSATGEVLNRAIITESAGAPLAPQPLTFEQLPLNVQATVNAATAELPIVGIDQNIVNGRTIYGVTVLQNGQPVQIRVNQDGRVVP